MLIVGYVWITEGSQVKLLCPQCGQMFRFNPHSPGHVFTCTWCKVQMPMPSFEELLPDDQAEYRREFEAAKRKADRKAKRERKKAYSQTLKKARKQKAEAAQCEAEREREKVRESVRRERREERKPEPLRLTQCPDCGHKVSLQAAACPECGRPAATKPIPMSGSGGSQQIYWCTPCQANTLHKRPAPNHVLHLLITLFLCGLWIPVWIVLAIGPVDWQCQQCGARGPAG